MAVFIREKRTSKRFMNFKFLKQAKAKRQAQVLINVTALVDMMTVMVIFLLMQFSTTGELLFVSKDLKVPGAAHGKHTKHAPVVSVNSRYELFVDGQLLEKKVMHSKKDGWRLNSLMRKLKQIKPVKNETESTRSAKVVNIQIDESIPFSVTKRVLYTCDIAGFKNINLAVTSKDSLNSAGAQADRKNTSKKKKA